MYILQNYCITSVHTMVNDLTFASSQTRILYRSRMSRTQRPGGVEEGKVYCHPPMSNLQPETFTTDPKNPSFLNRIPSFQVFLSFWRVGKIDQNPRRTQLHNRNVTGEDQDHPSPPPCRIRIRLVLLLLLLSLRNVNVDMSQRASLWAPSPMHDSVFIIFIKCLNQIDKLSSTILPMKLTNLIIAMKKVKTAFTAATALGSDLTNATAGDLDLVDLFFGQGSAAIKGVVEFPAVVC